jgi:regulator of sigma E protease
MRGVRRFGGAIENAERATPWRRALVVFAALAASYLVAAVPLTAACLTDGIETASTEVTAIPGEPAAEAGMATGDRVLSIDGRPVVTWEDLSGQVSKHPGEPVEVVVARGGEERRFSVTPKAVGGKGRIGVQSVMKREPLSLIAALSKGLAQPVRVIADSLNAFLATAAGKTGGELSGAMTVVRDTRRAAAGGGGHVLALIGALLAFVWPVTAITAVATVPRRAMSRDVSRGRTAM